MLQQASRYWRPILHRELNAFPDATVISLGEPVLSLLVAPGGSQKVREYWGYTAGWKTGEREELSCIPWHHSAIGRPVSPFPHQPSISKQFYADRLEEYVAFTRSHL